MCHYGRVEGIPWPLWCGPIDPVVDDWVRRIRNTELLAPVVNSSTVTPEIQSLSQSLDRPGRQISNYEMPGLCLGHPELKSLSDGRTWDTTIFHAAGIHPPDADARTQREWFRISHCKSLLSTMLVVLEHNLVDTWPRSKISWRCSCGFLNCNFQQNVSELFFVILDFLNVDKAFQMLENKREMHSMSGERNLIPSLSMKYIVNF